MAEDLELIERYQRAWVNKRGLTAQVTAAQADGVFLAIEENEIPGYEGEEAAYAWLLGITPISPQLKLAAEVNDATIIAEYRAADEEFKAGEARFDERVERNGPDRYKVDEAYGYAAGVRSALFWALSRDKGSLAS